MLAQYVYPSLLGLFRIIRHGRRWRALRECEEVGRCECEQGARGGYSAALITARKSRP